MTIEAMKQALEQAEKQEPVAWMRHDGKRVTTAEDRKDYPDYETRYPIPLYTSPPQRQPLTDEQCDEAIRRSGLWTLACTVPQNLAMLRGLCREAAHGIKENT